MLSVKQVSGGFPERFNKYTIIMINDTLKLFDFISPSSGSVGNDKGPGKKKLMNKVLQQS